MADQSLLVMKFGGTSIQDAAAMNRVLAIVTARMDHSPVLVISAISEATNILTTCTKLAAQGLQEQALGHFDDLYHRHRTIVKELLADPEQTYQKLDHFCQHARNLIIGLSLTQEFSLRILDRMVSFGELMSSTILADALNERGNPAKWLDARTWMTTNKDHGRARPIMDRVREKVQRLFLPLTAAKTIPVTQGYIGQSTDGISTTLGREGSDYTAAILANALAAVEINIWTDVDGILSADPRLVPSARKLDQLSYDVAAELTLAGAKVLHPNTLLPAVQANIPIRILNTFRPEGTGTRIYHTRRDGEAPDVPTFSVTSKANIIMVRAIAPPHHLPYSFFGSIFNIFDKYEIPLELVNTTHLYITLAFSDSNHTDRLLNELEAFTPIAVERNLAMVTIVSDHLQVPVLARRIDYRLFTAGATGISLSWIISINEVNEFVHTLHQQWLENRSKSA